MANNNNNGNNNNNNTCSYTRKQKHADWETAGRLFNSAHVMLLQ